MIYYRRFYIINQHHSPYKTCPNLKIRLNYCIITIMISHYNILMLLKYLLIYLVNSKACIDLFLCVSPIYIYLADRLYFIKRTLVVCAPVVRNLNNKFTDVLLGYVDIKLISVIRTFPFMITSVDNFN